MTLPNFDEKLDKYAKLITQNGVNVQPGQTIILYISVNQLKLARKIVDQAYQLGANEVVVEWNDSEITKGFLNHASEDRLQNQPAYVSQKADQLMEKKASRISVLSGAPDELKDVDSKRLSMYQKSLGEAWKSVRKSTQNNDISWLVVGAADQEWAKKVFPDLSSEAAEDKLWEEIFKTTRVDQDDPELAWDKQISTLNEKADWLNKHQFKALKYKSAKTDITIGLPKNHLWEAAGTNDISGNFFVPNMPTEEVFTSADNRNINGVISSTLPLSYSGSLIEGIQLTFKDGKIIDSKADTGEEILKDLIETDAGTHSLGEISLVPQKSPIAESGIIFYNTLFDENASDHVAIGAAYPFNIQGGTKMSDEELGEHGMNVSQTHVDFMVGSDDMNIDGILEDGSAVPVMRNGNWA
ncbi:aminopeptidase [Companilactobacillus metriopterae]|uniref:aminopeptidase n=1 Tax=Companilactobacillus metriopterae TaxID=1909267 RepID=UPI00100C0003|nr:aminopeptidase [Companilactobacillus metriopterae]